MKIQLAIIEGPEKGRCFEFDQADRFLVGRSYQSHFQLSQDDLYVSRNHFLLEISPPYCYLRDNKSTNGTFIKRKGDKEFRRIVEAKLHDDDLIKIGNTVLKVKVIEETMMTSRDGVCCIQCGSDISDALEGREAAELNASDYICQRCREKGPARTQPLSAKIRYLCRGCNKDVSLIANRDGRAEELADIALYLCEDCASREQEEVDIRNIKEYQILKELGRGGMGVVYKVWHTRTGRLLALKKILSEVTLNERANKLFQREMAVMRALVHPNIVRLTDQGMVGKEHYFVSEYLPDGDADELVIKVYKGPLPVKEACHLICPILQGLEFAHRKGFVHRDIKPQNILLTKDKKGHKVAKLSDFGLSKSYEQAGNSGITLKGEISGTPFFMAPEQFTNYRFVRPPADVYSIGATFYYLLTAKYQFRFPAFLDQTKAERPKDPILMILEDEPVPILKQNPHIPQTLAEVVDKAIRKDEKERFQTAKELEEAIKKAIN